MALTHRSMKSAVIGMASLVLGVDDEDEDEDDADDAVPVLAVVELGTFHWA